MANSFNVQDVRGDVATQAQMEAATNLTQVVTPGRTHFHPGVAKAFAVGNTDGSILLSYNISSVTDNGAGDWTFNFTTAPSGNYCTIPSILTGSALIARVDTASLNRVEVVSTINMLTDPNNWCVVFFGDMA